MKCTHYALVARDGVCPVCPEPESLQLARTRKSDIVREDQRRKAKRYRENFFEFCVAGWDIVNAGAELKPNWHHKVFAQHLQYAFVAWRKRKAGEVNEYAQWRNLIVNVEPGSAKSKFFSVLWLPWCWLWDPTLSFLSYSANPAVATRDGAATLDLIQSRWYNETFSPGWRVSRKQDAKTWFALEPREISGTRAAHGKSAKLGYRMAAGIESNAVGNRADILHFDDPQSPTEIYSQTYRKKSVEKHDKELFNRVNDKQVSLRVYVMQRLHREDLCGHLLTNVLDTRERVHLAIEGIYEEGAATPIWTDTRKPGETMHPERDGDEAALRREIARLGPQGYAQIQQRPQKDNTGSVINVDDFVELSRDRFPTEYDKTILTIDTNAKSFASIDPNSKGSNAAVIFVGIKGKQRYVIRDYTPPNPPGFAQLKGIVEQAIEACDPTHVLIESKAFGGALAADLSQLAPHKFVLFTPRASKEQRWALLASAASNDKKRNTWFVRPTLAGDIKTELAAAGTAARNDRADALAQIELWLAQPENASSWATAFES
ncbi:MAG: hypothetical protein E6Q97_02720 [Desulfurellales bacterium]|nr:MAG: hypothetical protein E6Q97_02720 [Desulfurellales bacterium]